MPSFHILRSGMGKKIIAANGVNISRKSEKQDAGQSI